MTILDLFNSLAQRAGLNADAAGLRELLSYTELAQKNVPADVATALDGLMSLPAAKNNSDLKAHFRQALYSTIDSKLTDALEAAAESGLLTPAQVEELTAEKSTPARVEKALARLAESKPKAGDKAAQQQITDLNKALADLKTANADALKAKDAEFTTFRRDQALSGALNDIKWADHFPEHLRPGMAKQALDAELAKVGADLVLSPDGKLTLKQKANPELDFFLDNKAVTLPDLVARVAAENKFIAVTPPKGDDKRPDTSYVPERGDKTQSVPATLSSAFDLARANNAPAG